MHKIAKFLIVLLVALVLSPVAFADSEYPVYIKDAEIYTRAVHNDIVGQVTICSSNYYKTSFTLKVKNLDVNTTYSRNLMLKDSGCETFDINFTDKFSDMTQYGDDVKLSLADIYSTETGEEYKEPESITTRVDKDKDDETCSNQTGEDGEYEVCMYSFLNHSSTGIRIKFLDYKNMYKSAYVDVLVSNIEWGGTEKLRIYTEREKEVIAKDKTRLTLSFLGKGENGGYLIQMLED